MELTKRMYDILLREYVTGKARKKYQLRSLECAEYLESPNYIYFRTYLKVSVIIDKANRVAYDLTPILFGEDYSMAKVRFNTSKFLERNAGQFSEVRKVKYIRWES